MTPKTAICQVGHPGSMESLVTMLQAVGWDCLIPGEHLRDRLKSIGCDTIVNAAGIAEGWGDKLRVKCGPALPYDMMRPDVVYIDTKAHRNGPKVWAQYPHLENRTLWYRINGGRPCIVPGKGDEINPPCPVLTPDPWYDPSIGPNIRGDGVLPLTTLHKSYSAWPLFARWGDHQRPRIPPSFGQSGNEFGLPVCLTHALSGWGYGDVGAILHKTVGLLCFGGYGSPDGMYPYRDVPGLLSRVVCLVHLKSQDCPGYSLYEALASACPVVVSRMLIDWCQMHSLFIEGETCLCYDRGLDDGGTAKSTYGPIDVEECSREAAECVERLRDPALNRRIGEAGRERLRKLMWSPVAESSTSSLREFLGRMFP